MPNDPSQPQFDSTDILIAEFNYIAQTAFQANEDRSRVTNFYFITAGAAIGAILSAKVDPNAAAGVYAGLSGLFLVLTFVGLFTILQLARLRTAWEESAHAMNVIKDYYCRHSDQLKLEPALFWRMQTVPKGRNWKTVAFLLAFSVLAICVATTTAFFVYAVLAWCASFKILVDVTGGIVMGAIGVVLGFGVAVGQYLLYEKWIRDAEAKAHSRLKDHYDLHKDYLTKLVD